MRGLLALCLGLGACVTAPPTRFEVPKDTPAQCSRMCTDMGLKMSAVVVIMNASGCVCEPPAQSPPSSVTSGAAAAVGGATIAAAAAANQNHPPSQPSR